MFVVLIGNEMAAFNVEKDLSSDPCTATDGSRMVAATTASFFFFHATQE
jgi:hypothetical protein